MGQQDTENTGFLAGCGDNGGGWRRCVSPDKAFYNRWSFPVSDDCGGYRGVVLAQEGPSAAGV